MKRVIFIITILYTFIWNIQAQEPRFIFDKDSLNAAPPKVSAIKKDSLGNPSMPIVNDSLIGDSMQYVLPKISAWRINSITGERIVAQLDTLYSGFNQKSLVDGQDVAVGYLGNWGSPAQSKIFFDREESSQFNFLNPFSYYYKKPQDHVFLSTKLPYSNITYESGGGRKNKEERFLGEMSVSFNKKFTIGFDIDYTYARGYYSSLATKQNGYDIFASYISDKYQMHAFFANNNYMNLENGGLVVPTNIPSDYFDTSSTELPTNYSDTWNKLRGRTLYMTHKYSIGYNAEQSENFVPVASAFFTTNYADQRREFTSNVVTTLDSLYHYTPSGLNLPTNNNSSSTSSTNNTTKGALADYMSYYSLKNTLGISLNEGFRPWVKFGLTGFIQQDTRKYLMSSEVNPTLSRTKYSQNATSVGGILSKRKGDLLRYDLSAEVGVMGYNSGETKLKADISSTINIKGKDVTISANGYIKNTKPTFFENNFHSRYYNWEYDFNDTKRTFIGGNIYIPHTKTRLSGGFENIKNYIYYNKIDSKSNTTINQENGNIRVASLRLDQNMSVGILHFNNQLVYQKTSNKDVLPLPELSLYSNLYIQFKVSKVLDVQLGVDAHYNTKYYAPGYDPALLQFYNQKKQEIGNFPLSTAYANLHLKRTRFYFMMYNVAKGFVDTPYFDIEGYAYNPMIFKFGLTWNFTN